MHRCLLSIMLIIGMLVVSAAGRPEEMLSPPGRPSEFTTPYQLRRYLKALNDYYAIVGRPRFGRSVKRQPLETYGEGMADVFGDSADTE